MLYNQVSAFAAQVHQLTPKIGAAGFFNVGLDMFPTVNIGARKNLRYLSIQ